MTLPIGAAAIAADMETVLNLIWLVLALAMFCVWRYRWGASQHNGTHKWTAAIALSCALALLFPVISLTDDLHPETVAIDGSTGKRNGRRSLVAASLHHPLAQKCAAHSIAAVLPSSAAVINFAAVRAAFFVVVLSFVSLSPHSGGRSPPLPL
ncbi:MAG TPA: hypothetical protein VN862_09770 [Candidatus Acidoferrales bacterium]|nr:hypothetical protein [Candidatus Acidoferrales bacterium]